MNKRIQLTINEPCHENWERMTQAEKGRFCGSCQKHVLDFTSMSDAQLAAFFKKPSTGEVCGRFFPDQLDRDVEIPRKRIPWVKYFFQFALPAFLFSSKAVAQGKVIMGKLKVPTENLPRLTLGQASVKPAPEIFIKGKIVGFDNLPVPFATVAIVGTRAIVAADSIGEFKIVNPGETATILLQVSSVGYKTKEVMLNALSASEKPITIQLAALDLSEVVGVMMGVILRKETRFIPTKKMDSTEKCTDTETKKKAIEPPLNQKSPMIKVYPNPVASGSTINISCEQLEEGYYLMRLSSQSGQELQKKQIWIDADARIINMEVPVVATGNYILTLSNKETGKTLSEKIVIHP
ncbi:MAG: carboxypeptidase-like regulatory domain-containing protein [Chitinophagaceae bacterium]|nr:carboxypeptidase-like regulatory domain-containing protein [Chitinophagaceae bacterium]